MPPNTVERRYALTSGFYPTATRSDRGLSWKQSAAGQGILRVSGVDWDGKPNFNAEYPIKGSRVWYQKSTTLRGARNEFDTDVNDANAILTSGGGFGNLAKMFGTAMVAAEPHNRALGGMLWGAGRQRRGKLGGKSLFDQRRLRSVKPEDNPASKMFRDLFEEYRTKSSAYSRQFQRELIGTVNRLGQSAGANFKIDAKRAQESHPIREKAHHSRAASEEQMSPEEADYEPIGKTQAMDAYVKIGNRIVGVDVSQEVAISGAEQSRQYHHSLTGGALMDEAEFEEATNDTIRHRMKEYYTTEINDRWNPSIVNLRRLTQEMTGRQQVTADEMRNPLEDPSGSTPIDSALHYSDDQGRIISGAGNSTQRAAVMTHLFHWIGNYAGNQAGAYDTFTLQHKPVHRTASIFLRQYAASNRSRAFEFKKVREKDAEVYYGPALYNIGRKLGYYQNLTATQFTQDAQLTQLAARTYGSRGNKAVINGSNLAVNAVAKPKVAIDLFIPDKHNAEIMETIAENMAGAAGQQWQEHFHNQMQMEFRNNTTTSSHSMGGNMAPATFNRWLRSYGQGLAREHKTAPASYRFWASPFYGTEFVGDTRQRGHE